MSAPSLSKAFFVLALFAVFVVSISPPVALADKRPTTAAPEPAMTACATTSMRTSDPTLTATKAQIAFDLCYLAGQIQQVDPAVADHVSSPKAAYDQVVAAYKLESAMQQIVMESSYLLICPTPVPNRDSDDHVDPADPDHARLHRWGCGPYSKYYDVQDPPLSPPSPTQCYVTRPTPVPAIQGNKPQNTIHPPTNPKIASFDLCRAATLVHVLPAEQIEPYMLNLLLDVHLALTCGNGREHESVLYGETPSIHIPTQTDASYIKFRRFGCSPASQPKTAVR